MFLSPYVHALYRHALIHTYVQENLWIFVKKNNNNMASFNTENTTDRLRLIDRKIRHQHDINVVLLHDSMTIFLAAHDPTFHMLVSSAGRAPITKQATPWRSQVQVLYELQFLSLSLLIPLSSLSIFYD